MKDPKNIDFLNQMVTYYITLHGLQGVPLEPDNPFSEYFTQVAMKGNMFYLMSMSGEMMPPNMKNDMVVSTSTVHQLIKEGYEFYKTMDDFDSTIHPMMKEQVMSQLGDTKFNEFLESSINTYKNSFFQILNNYNSYKDNYVKIKLDILEEKMNDCAEFEDYEMAAEMRDKIKELKSKI